MGRLLTDCSSERELNPAAGDWAVPQKAATALDRYGHVDEIAAMVAFAASCVTGRRSNQLNYAPAWDKVLTLLLCLLMSPGSLSRPPVIIVPSDVARFPLASSRSLPFHLTVP